MFLWCSSFVIALCLRVIYALNGPAADLVTSLPGLSETPNFQHYSGYLQAAQGKYLHYWFVESQNNPSTDPVVLWLNGGPGCSSMEGLLAENGPFHLHDDGTVYLNPYSWNLLANVLYVESPPGVGFSYSTTGNYQTSDPQVAEDNYNALLDFFNKFPSFTSNDFYVFAESYGGIYAPTLSKLIASSSANINFKGMGVGNGMTSYTINDNSLVYFGYYHGLIGNSLWNEINQYCCSSGTCNFDSNSNSNCQNAVTSVNVYNALYLIQDIGLNIYNVYALCYGGAGAQSRYTADMSNLFRHYRFKFQDQVSHGFVDVSVPGDPRCFNGTALYVWLNNPNVRAALHIPTSVQSWELCSSTVGSLYQRTYSDMTPFYQYLLQQNLRLLVYNGDVDMACNFLGAEWFVEALNQSGAGHMVPQYKPAAALQMFKNYLSNSY
uniref:Lysosomal protective protein n=1 Tax=Pygocentrus nattereri TaxID=42514 RepID=A0A3B4CM12_PYGNA